MSTSQKQKFPNQRQTEAAAQQSNPMHDSFAPEKAAFGSPEITEEKFPEKPSYLKYTFANPYNLTLLGGAIAASVFTLNPLIAIAALGVSGFSVKSDAT